MLPLRPQNMHRASILRSTIISTACHRYCRRQKQQDNRHTKVPHTRSLSCKPEIAKRRTQVDEVLWDKARWPGTVASAIERVARPAREEESRGLRDGHIWKHRLYYFHYLRLHLCV